MLIFNKQKQKRCLNWLHVRNGTKYMTMQFKNKNWKSFACKTRFEMRIYIKSLHYKKWWFPYQPSWENDQTDQTIRIQQPSHINCTAFSGNWSYIGIYTPNPIYVCVWISTSNYIQAIATSHASQLSRKLYSWVISHFAYFIS